MIASSRCIACNLSKKELKIRKYSDEKKKKEFIQRAVKEQLSKEARKYLDSADVIIAKGMGNFESMYQEGINLYYLFLCKCDLFTTRFGVKLFDLIFCKEERLEIHSK